ncbi:MAG: hypothetical protein NZO58_01040 [Gemmataceae bacterium]|nr:hypothetical protein [Gemmataceae bacterium]
MSATLSLFLDFNLPNATTWFYFSFLLSVSLFFKFGRLLSMRNWDVVTIFLLVPGLIFIQPPRPTPLLTSRGLVDPRHPTLQIARLTAGGTIGAWQGGITAVGSLAEVADADWAPMPAPWLWYGYLWLMVGSLYFLCRCLVDLALVQRPALAPNLSFGGLAFLAAALLSCLVAVAFRGRAHDPFPEPQIDGAAKPNKPVGPETATLAQVREWTETRWWLARGSAVTCHLAVVVGLVLIGRRHFGDPAAGMAAATMYLLLPYTGLYIGQLQHVLPAALIVWAIVVSARPMLAGGLLGLATGASYFPALLLPIWFSYYWKRGSGRFLFAFLVAVSATLVTIGVSLAIDGSLEASLRYVAQLADWQPWKTPTSEGFWTGIHAGYRLPVFVVYAAFVLATIVWPAPKNLAHVLALSAATIVGIQLWYADKGGVYVLWYLPLLVLLVFRPNLVERRPPPINPDTDWLCRLRRALWGQAQPKTLTLDSLATSVSPESRRRLAG